MTTTMGGGSRFVSGELIVEQDAVNRIGVAVDSLVVEFDQAKYEAYLYSLASPKKATGAYQKIGATACVPPTINVPSNHLTCATKCQGVRSPPTSTPTNRADVSTYCQGNSCTDSSPSSAIGMWSAI